jgi:sarcosine/dimethylglycine N-methyltransferase
MIYLEELSAFDQLHYHGTDALDIAIRLIGVKPGQSLLEIGSGIGDPARYLANNSGAHITALELQADQNQVTEQLSQRCGISEKLSHQCGDFLTYDWGNQRFDAIVRWLALYHIPDRRQLLTRCHDLLNPGGRFYTEDLCCKSEFNSEELQELERELYAITVPGISIYSDDLETAGFEIEYVEDMTDDWSEFTSKRLDAYRTDRARHVRVRGEATVDALDEFKYLRRV